jgi:hypothetical protein
MIQVDQTAGYDAPEIDIHWTQLRRTGDQTGQITFLDKFHVALADDFI